MASDCSRKWASIHGSGGRREDVASISTISSLDALLWMQAHKDWDFVDTFTEEEKGRYTIGVFLLLLPNKCTPLLTPPSHSCPSTASCAQSTIMTNILLWCRLAVYIDFVVCVGGDGVILHASYLFKRAIPPVRIGLNTALSSKHLLTVSCLSSRLPCL